MPNDDQGVELDINGAGPADAAPIAQAKAEKPQQILFDSAGLSNEELVDRILQVDQEKLIPWELIEIPSRGIYYGWVDGMCQIRPMGQTAEKILVTQRLVSSGQAIDYLFRECCQFPNGFDPVDLLVGDRAFLLYYLRGITHGQIYEFTTTCPNEECGAISPYAYNLNELASTIRYADPSLGQEPFQVTLPHMSEIVGRHMYVGVRFMRASDANDIASRRRVKKKATSQAGVRTRGRGTPKPQGQQDQNVALDSILNDNLEKLIVHVQGVRDPLRIREFITRLHARDTATIREWLRDNTPGIDTTVEITCSGCQIDYAVELPITEAFFRPAKSGGTR